MKKLLFSTVLFLAFFSAANAQTEMGNWLVGGNLNLNTAKNNSTISLSPSAAYFFAKNFAGGAMLNLSYNKVGTNKTTGFGIGPFARYYFGSLNVRPFVDAELGFQTSKYKSTSGSDTYNSTQYFLGGGLAAFINRNVAIEGLAGYRKDINASGGFNLRIGFQVYISRGEVESMTK